MKRVIFSVLFFLAVFSLIAQNKSSLLAHWSFDDLKSKTVKDSSGNLLNGQIFGAKHAEGLSGNALSFSNGAHALIPWKPKMSGMDKMTMIVWIKVNQADERNNQEIIDSGYARGRWQYILRVRPVISTFRFQIKDKEDGYGAINGDTPIQMGKWHHVAAVSDGEFLRLYVDGKADALPLPCNARVVEKKCDLLIGRTFNGELDDVKIYDRALSEKELKEDFLVFEKHLREYERKALKATETDWIANKSYRVPAEWMPRSFMGRNFWMLLKKWKWMLPGIAEKAFVVEAAVSRIPIEGLKQSKNSFIREVTFGNKREKSIEYVAKQDGVGSDVFKFKNLENIGDNDEKSFAFRLLSQDEEFKQGKIIFDFTKPVEVSKINLKQGYVTGAPGKAPLYAMSKFMFQYWDGKDWRDIKKTVCQENRNSENKFVFPAVKTKRMRLLVNGGSLIDYNKYCEKDKPYFFIDSFLRHHRGGIKKVSEIERKRIKEVYENFLEINKEGCLGFWIGEWANDINWAPYRYQKNLPELVEFAYGNKSKDKSDYPKSLPPQRPKEACELLEKIYKSKRSFLFDNAFGLNCAFQFDHYNLEWGGNMPAIELTVCGEGRSRYNLQTAFCRGAARQYGKPWMHYDAYFYLSGNPDYINHVPLKKALNPTGADFGIPVSLGKRSMLHAYYAGATFFDFESQSYAFVQDRNMDGVYELSPHGKVLEELYKHAVDYPDRGASYTPVLLLLDYYHGWAAFVPDKMWFSIPCDKGAYMLQEFIKTVWEYETLFPRRKERSDKSVGLVNTRYGDIFDVMLLNPPSGIISLKTLLAYKAALLLGSIRFTPEAVAVLEDYVASGGTLFLNSAQVNDLFSQEFLGAEIVKDKNLSFEIRVKSAVPLLTQNGKILVSKNKYGKGHLILSSPAYLLDESGKKAHPLVREILSHISSEVLPLKVEGDIGYQLNAIDQENWILTLMNNKGVIKDRFHPEEFDPQKTAFVRVKFKSKPVEIFELKEDGASKLSSASNLLEAKVPPGGVKIYRVKFAKNKH